MSNYFYAASLILTFASFANTAYLAFALALALAAIATEKKQGG